MKMYSFLVLVVMALGFAQNLLQNPDFEQWSPGVPNYWLKADSVLLYQEDENVYSGNSSAKDSFFSTTAENTELYQGFNVQAFTNYVFSIMIFDNDNAGDARVGLQWYKDGAYLSSNWPNHYSSDSSNWQVWIDSTTSPDADSVRFIIRCYDYPQANWDGGAVLYLDSAYFGPSLVQPPIITGIWHTPINPDPVVTENVYATASDANGMIVADTLLYGVNNLLAPIEISHMVISGDTFRYQIPGQAAGDTVFYCIKFTDDDGLATISDTQAYIVGKVGVYINEVVYDVMGYPDIGAFIELYGPGSTDLDSFTLVGVNGNDGDDYQTIDLSGSAIPPDGFFVIAYDASTPNYDLLDSAVDYQNGPDNIELRLHNITIDALGYGTLDGWYFTGEWLPTPDVGPDTSLGRFPDGHDTDNNFLDFYAYDSTTPGTANPELTIYEASSMVINLPVIKNPVVSGVLFSSVIADPGFYPIKVYNILGRMVEKVLKPETKIDLAVGIYFLKSVKTQENNAKLIVVK